MKFRPCIDIHNGKVKQIVGGSLIDDGNQAKENYVSKEDASFYASMYKKHNLKGGHIILLNSSDSKYYNDDITEAMKALKEYPLGFQIGGGIGKDNAKTFLDGGASHVIVTSYVFHDGKIDYDNLNNITNTIGKDRLVLDLSCRKKDGKYYIVTDRWQKYTDVVINSSSLDFFSDYCDEFLIHGVDVEGKFSGIEEDLVEILGNFSGIPITYAGGISSRKDLDLVKSLGKEKIDVTIGSALDLFGGSLKLEDVLDYFSHQ